MTLALVFKTLVSIKRSLGFVRQVAQETLSFLIPGFSGKFSRCDSDQTGGAILQLVRHYKNVACRTVCSQPPSTSSCESIFLLHLYLHINQAVFGWQNNDTPPVCHGIVHIDVLSETAGEQHKIRKKTNFIFCFKTEDSIFGQQSSKKPQSNKIITPMCVPKKCYQRRKVSLIKKRITELFSCSFGTLQSSLGKLIGILLCKSCARATELEQKGLTHLKNLCPTTASDGPVIW